MFVTPDTTKTQAQTCEVVAVGPGRTLDSGSLLPLTVTPGSKVYIGKYSGSELKLPALGDDYLIVREEEILGEILS
jgi:chaperonin GroES